MYILYTFSAHIHNKRKYVFVPQKRILFQAVPSFSSDSGDQAQAGGSAQEARGGLGRFYLLIVFLGCFIQKQVC